MSLESMSRNGYFMRLFADLRWFYTSLKRKFPFEINANFYEITRNRRMPTNKRMR